MSYDNEVAKVCRLTNGWSVEIYDPPPAEVKAEEKAEKKGSYVPEIGIYKTPWKSFAFSTYDEVIKFLGEKLSTLKPRNFDDEYSKAFTDTVTALSKPKGKK